MASFLVFFISLAGAATGDDPIMPSFWRALGTLAVLTTLSFAASWFMPAPSDRRQLLDRIEAEERLVDDRRPRRRGAGGQEPGAGAAPEPPQEEPTKGASIDVTVEDELDANQDELAGAEDDDDEDEDEDDFDDEDQDESLVAAVPGAAQAEQERYMEGR